MSSDSNQAAAPTSRQKKCSHIEVEDGIRGTLSMPENNQDVVILKANGIRLIILHTSSTTFYAHNTCRKEARNGCRLSLFMLSFLKKSALKCLFSATQHSL